MEERDRICYAIKNGDRVSLKEALQPTSNTDRLRVDGLTLLSWAIREGYIESCHEEVCELLLEARKLEKEKPEYVQDKEELQDLQNTLFSAYENKKYNLVKILLKHDITGDIKDKEEKSVYNLLMRSCKDGEKEIADILINHNKVNVNKTFKNISALHLASQNRNCEIAKNLILAGANKDELADIRMNGVEFHATPLMIAVQNGDLPVVNLFIHENVNLSVQNRNGDTALLLALKNCNYSEHSYLTDLNDPIAEQLICEKLITASPAINISNKDGMSPLIVAVENRNRKAVEALCKNKVTIQSKAMVMALEMDDSDYSINLIKCFISHDANIVNVLTDNGDTLLDVASRNGNPEQVQTLIDKGGEGLVKKFPSNTSNNTPLINASLHGHANVVEILLINGAKDKVNACNILDFNALMYAACHNHLEVVKNLVKYGANINYANAQEITALDIAAEEGNEDIVDFLLNHGIKYKTKNCRCTPLIWASAAGHENVVRSLVSHDADVGIRRSSDKASALHVASKYGHSGVVGFLLDSGASEGIDDTVDMITGNPEKSNLCGAWGVKYLEDSIIEHDFKNDGGYSSLMLASMEGHTNVISSLLDHHANIDLATRNENTALTLACRGGHYRSVQTLIDGGANINHKTFTGDNALSMAIQCENIDIIKYLLKNGIERHERERENILNLVKPENQKEYMNELFDKKATRHQKENMERLYKRFIKDIGSNVPDYIQHVMKGETIPKIFISIDKGKREIAEAYIKSRFCSYSEQDLSIFEFLEQPQETEYLLCKHDTNLPEISDQLKPKCGISSGSPLVVVPPEKLDPILTNDRIKSVSDVIKTDNALEYGSLACFAKDEDENVYGVTCAHVIDSLSGSKVNESLPIVTNVSIKVPLSDTTHDKVVHFGNIVYETNEPFSNERDGSLDMADIALCKLENERSPHINETICTSKPITLCNLGDEDLIGKCVEKNGSKTGNTQGKIIGTIHLNIKGELSGGFFLVVPYKASKFADNGDAGSLVYTLSIESPENSVYSVKLELFGGNDESILTKNASGLLYKRQKMFCHEDMASYPEVFVCLRLDRCLDRLCVKHNKSVTLYDSVLELGNANMDNRLPAGICNWIETVNVPAGKVNSEGGIPASSEIQTVIVPAGKVNSEGGIPASSEIQTVIVPAEDVNSMADKDNKDIQRIYWIITELLKREGPLKHTDQKILKRLMPVDMMLVLQTGSIKDFLCNCDGVKIKGDMLHCNIEETLNEKKMVEADGRLKKIQAEMNDILKDTNVKPYIRGTCRNLQKDKICIAVDVTKVEYVKKWLKKHKDFHRLEIYGLDAKSCFLKGPDSEYSAIPECSNSSKPELQPFIGPGSVLMHDENLEKFKDMQDRRKNPNKFEIESAFEKPRYGYGTLGCFVHCESKERVYALSAKHIINTKENDHTDPIDNVSCANMISGFKHTNTLPYQFTPVAQDCVHISQNYIGILGEFESNCVDVALFGPVPQSLLSIHKHNELNDKDHLLKLSDMSDINIEHTKVYKVGARTGLTTGIVLQTDFRDDHEDYDLNDDPNAIPPPVRGTFVVTSYTGEEPDIYGKFGLPGDSGSIVMVNNGSNQAVGIIHRIIYKGYRILEKEYKNVIVCVRLDHCIDALKKCMPTLGDLKFYYYYLEPLLFLAKQDLKEDVPETRVSCATTVENVGFCCQPTSKTTK